MKTLPFNINFFISKFDRLIQSKYIILTAGFLAGILMIPSLQIDFFMDDYHFLEIHEKSFPIKAANGEDIVNPFTIFSGDLQINKTFTEYGFVPWWTQKDLKMAFWRPLSAALSKLDFLLFGYSAIAHHIHSILWLIAYTITIGIILRHILPLRIAGLAVLIVALNEAHTIPVTWLAYRNSFISIVPALWGLWCHLRWREKNWNMGLPLSILLFTVGLLGGETALGILPYIVFYELLGHKKQLKDRFIGILPCFLVFISYLTIYKIFNFGTFGSGLYLDPMSEPISYIIAASGRIPALLADAFTGFFLSESWMLLPEFRPLQISIGIISVIVFVSLLHKSSSAQNVKTEKLTLRWLTAAAFISLLPVAASLPRGGGLLSAGLGFSAGIASITIYLWQISKSQVKKLVFKKWIIVISGTAIVLVHLVLSPLISIGLQIDIAKQSKIAVEAAQKVTQTESDATRDHILLLAPNYPIEVAFYMPLIQRHYSKIPIQSWRILSLAPFNHTFLRTDSNIIQMSVVNGELLSTMLEQLFRSPLTAFKIGEKIPAGFLTVEIIEIGSSGPTTVNFHFDRDLDDKSLRFLVWEDNELKEVTPPSLGKTISLLKPQGPIDKLIQNTNNS